MSANKRASIKKNNPLEQLFSRQEGKTTAEEASVAESASTADTGTPAAPVNSKEVAFHKTSLLVTEDQLFWLEEQCLQARRGGRTLHKAELIRALIDIARDSEVDLAELQDQEDLAQKLTQAIKGA
jgi:hypothetical protein